MEGGRGLTRLKPLSLHKRKLKG